MTRGWGDSVDAAREPPAAVTGLPVAVVLPEPLAAEVTAYVESELGWQVVATDGPVRPTLLLTDAPLGPASVVLTVAQTVAEDAGHGARGVLRWPEERSRLVDLAGVGAVAAAGDTPPLVRVAGAAGGVGTSTVALAVGGLLAWSGSRVVVLGGEGLCRLAGVRWQGPGADELAALSPAEAAAEFDAIARPVVGVDDLTVVRGAPLDATPGWPVDLVVVDHGAADPDRADLLLARPDAHLAVAADLSVPVVLTGGGPLDPAGVARVLRRAPAGALPVSARVARAGLAGRIPSGLPGTWLRALERVLPAVELASP